MPKRKTQATKQEDFIIQEKDLSKALGIKITQLYKIVKAFDARDDDPWELIENEHFRFLTKDPKIENRKRIYSPEGAFAIAKYIDQHPEFDKRTPFKKFFDWVTNKQKKIRKRFFQQHIMNNLDIRNPEIVHIGANEIYITKKTCVKLLKTSHAKWNSVFRDIQTSSTLFDPVDDYVYENGDVFFYSPPVLARIALHLSKELTNPQRRLDCEAVEAELEPTIKLILSAEDSRKNRIKKAKEHAMSRDKNQCQVSRKKQTQNNNLSIEAHHLYSEKHFPDLEESVDNLITLQTYIHREFHAWNGGTQQPCTIDKFIEFLNLRYPDCKDDLFLRLQKIKKMFGDPQIIDRV